MLLQHGWFLSFYSTFFFYALLSLSHLLSVTPSILKAMSERQFEFTSSKRVRVATGTWNVNGGKQFRSNILGTSELTDWLLDSPKLSGVSEFQGKIS